MYECDYLIFLTALNSEAFFLYWGFPSGIAVKNPSASEGYTRDLGSIPGLGRSPGKGNGNPLQYSCWEIPWAEQPGGLVYGVARIGHD